MSLDTEALRRVFADEAGMREAHVIAERIVRESREEANRITARIFAENQREVGAWQAFESKRRKLARRRAERRKGLRYLMLAVLWRVGVGK